MVSLVFFLFMFFIGVHQAHAPLQIFGEDVRGGDEEGVDFHQRFYTKRTHQIGTYDSLMDR